MKATKSLCPALLLAGVMYAPALFAIPFTGVATGAWQNVVHDADDVFSIVNNDAGAVATFNWGTGVSLYPSFITFDGVGSDGDPQWVAEPGDAFLLGNFTYYNSTNSVYSADGIEGVDLALMIDITSPIGVVDVFNFSFDISNTINSGSGCCADIVSALNMTTPTIFDYDGGGYSLELLGFSTDGGATVDGDFAGPENRYSKAEVYGRITAVPEPGILLMMGTGLLVLLLLRRRQIANV